MTEAKRRKRQSRIIRISRDVDVFLNRARKHKGTYDAILRKLLGLDPKKGQAEPLKHYWVIPNGNDPVIYNTEAQAKGGAIVLAVKQHRKEAHPVIKVREVV